MTGLPAASMAGLSERATVSSGRAGIVAAEAPIAVLQLATGRSTADRASLIGSVPQELISQPLRETFQVRLIEPGGETDFLGTIYIRRYSPAAWVLEVE